MADNPALAASVKRGPVIPVFIWAPEEEGSWPPGGASRWWLHNSLAALDAALRRKHSRLILRQGSTLKNLQELIRTTGARAVYWNRLYQPAARARDAHIQETLRQMGCEAESFNSALLFEPWQIMTQSGGPYQVFTPFWRACLKMPEPVAPLREPRTLSSPRVWPRSVPLVSLRLEPRMDWTGGIRATWQPGESGARKQLRRFVRAGISDYDHGRNLPSLEGTSRLSPFLHFGEISPRQIWHAAQTALARRTGGEEQKGYMTFLREIGWREFAYHLLYHFPNTPERPLRRKFERLEWLRDAKALKAWQRGRTGFPIVDAGMRELWATGWMHNRVRMIVASFLAKDLLLPWQLGARWFWDTLVDADLANNTLGWQWTAGCGADAAPFFRVFHPVRQGEKFDPAGNYIRRWVPELGKLPAQWIHKPWEAPQEVLEAAQVARGTPYQRPIVDHAKARARALAAFAGIRDSGKDRQ